MAKKKDTKKQISEKNKWIFLLVAGIIVIISLLLIISGSFGNFEKVKLRKNNKEIFTDFGELLYISFKIAVAI